MKWLAGCTYLGVILIATSAVPNGASAAGTVSSTVITAAAALTLFQSDYRWYANENDLTPTVPLTASENSATSTPEVGTALRLRMNLGANILSLGAGADFTLQFSATTTGGWADVGTSSTPWVFLDNAGVADGQIIVTTVLSTSDVGESYGESNPSAASPNTIVAGQEGEWDWVLLNLSAATSSGWYFRMIYASGTPLDAYVRYPSLSARVSPAPPPSAPPTGVITGGSGPPLFVPPTATTTPVPTTTRPGFEIVVGPKPPSPCDSLIVQRIDLSGDCRVDMIDLSILVYYYRRTGPSVARYDLNGDGTVDLFDVSVMMFYWTGP